jgi:hypothetical protein
VIYNGLNELKSGLKTAYDNNGLGDATDAIDNLRTILEEVDDVKSDIYDYVDKARTGFKGF